MVEFLDFVDGAFNLVGMLCLIGATIIGLRVFNKKRDMSTLVFLMLFAGSGLFAFGNVLDKWGFVEEAIGDAFATGFVNITGHPKNLQLDISATTNNNTEIFIPLSSREKLTESNFITFINQDEENTDINGSSSFEEYQIRTGGIQFNIDLEITPEAETQIIFDSQIGDVMKGNGNGNLQIEYDPIDKLKIFGDYTIE